MKAEKPFQACSTGASLPPVGVRAPPRPQRPPRPHAHTRGALAPRSLPPAVSGRRSGRDRMGSSGRPACAQLGPSTALVCRGGRKAGAGGAGRLLVPLAASQSVCHRLPQTGLGREPGKPRTAPDCGRHGLEAAGAPADKARTRPSLPPRRGGRRGRAWRRARASRGSPRLSLRTEAPSLLPTPLLCRPELQMPDGGRGLEHSLLSCTQRSATMSHLPPPAPVAPHRRAPPPPPLLPLLPKHLRDKEWVPLGR